MDNDNTTTVTSVDYQSAIDRMALAATDDEVLCSLGENADLSTYELLAAYKQIARVMLQALLMGKK